MTTADNSRDAHRSVKPLKSGMRERLHGIIKMRGERGLTVDELEIVTGMPHQTVSARVHEMAKLGTIVDTGKRPTRSGRNAAVWIAAK